MRKVKKTSGILKKSVKNVIANCHPKSEEQILYVVLNFAAKKVRIQLQNIENLLEFSLTDLDLIPEIYHNEIICNAQSILKQFQKEEKGRAYVMQALDAYSLKIKFIFTFFSDDLIEIQLSQNDEKPIFLQVTKDIFLRPLDTELINFTINSLEDVYKSCSLLKKYLPLEKETH